MVFSCVVTAPAYDPVVVSEVGSASNMTNDLYDKIINSSDKSYSTYANDYETVALAINHILILDSARERNKIILKIANDIKNRFATYRAEHEQAGTRNNTQLETYKNGMHALWSALYNSEVNYKP